MIRWKNLNIGSDKASAPIMTPSWLRVDSAMIFFISHSNNADIPAINIVIVAIISRMVFD